VSFALKNSEVRLIGKSEAIRTIEADIECAARSDAKVLVTGETGVGKEVVSRLIHQRSARANASLVTLNCAGLPDSLVESELLSCEVSRYIATSLVFWKWRRTARCSSTKSGVSTRCGSLLRFLETGEIQRIG
jgi:transcriptional regulator of aromatic amino acid metabolism